MKDGFNYKRNGKETDKDSVTKKTYLQINLPVVGFSLVKTKLYSDLFDSKTIQSSSLITVN